jgi:hypothetical protein
MAQSGRAVDRKAESRKTKKTTGRGFKSHSGLERKV